MKRAATDMRIDGVRNQPAASGHVDADAIAVIVAVLPDTPGGLRMALCLAKLARAGPTLG